MPTRRDWLLLFLGAEGGSYPADQVRVMKGMFLLDRTPGHPAYGVYRFEPYDYGPFDAGVYRDLDALELEGLIRVNRIRGTSRRTFALTDCGQMAWNRLADLARDSDLACVQAVKKRVTSLGFDELLRQIYREYPEFAMYSRARMAQAV